MLKKTQIKHKMHPKGMTLFNCMFLYHYAIYVPRGTKIMFFSMVHHLAPSGRQKVSESTQKNTNLTYMGYKILTHTHTKPQV